MRACHVPDNRTGGERACSGLQNQTCWASSTRWRRAACGEWCCWSRGVGHHGWLGLGSIAGVLVQRAGGLLGLPEEVTQSSLEAGGTSEPGQRLWK